MSIRINDLPMLVDFFIQVGQAVIDIGARLLSYLSAFDLHIICGIKGLKDNAHVMDVSVANSLVRSVLYVSQDAKLGGFFRGVGGESIQLQGDEYIDWHKVHHVQVSHEISGDLHSNITIYVDGATYKAVSVDFPLLTTSDWTPCHVLYNKNAEAEVGEANCLFIAAIMIYGVRQNPSVRAAMLLHCQKYTRPRSSGHMFGPGEYAVSVAGNRDLEFIGEPKKMTVSRFEKVAYAPKDSF
jgi:hypothetical protein